MTALPQLQQSPLQPIEEAYSLMRTLLEPLDGTEIVSLRDSLGRVAAHDIQSTIPLPSGDNSAVDGYGISEADLHRIGVPLEVVGRVVAGDRAGHVAVREGQAVYLATGAPIPTGVAGVIMVEHAARAGSKLLFTTSLSSGANIRRRGEDVGINSTIVRESSIIDHRHIGILAAAGQARVAVKRRIRVELFSSGDELVSPGDPLQDGQVYDVNAAMLSAMLSGNHIECLSPVRLPDSADDAARALRSSEAADLIITTGGAAGSETDHTAEAIRLAGGQATSQRLALRPGKPIVVGRLRRSLVLGLPGNPTAAMIGFLLFVKPVLLALGGGPLRRPQGYAAIAEEALAVKPGRLEFAPAAVVGKTQDGRLTVRRLGRGGSSRLSPLVEADGLVELMSAGNQITAGDHLIFHPFEAPFGAH